MTEQIKPCRWCEGSDEVCVNADCPLCAGFCPLRDYPGVCRYEDRGEEKKILDMTCGAKTMWFNKQNPAAIFMDKRCENHTLFFGAGKTSPHEIQIKPDLIADFTNLPFSDNSFALVVFDPPHLKGAKETSWLVKKYGKLDDEWPKMLRDGFAEGMRVLKPNGVLIFKWGEYDIPAAKVWEAIGQKPLFGHHSGKNSTTFWGAFMKGVL